MIDDFAPDFVQPPFSSPCAAGQDELVRGVHFLDPSSTVDDTLAEALQPAPEAAESDDRNADSRA